MPDLRALLLFLGAVAFVVSQTNFQIVVIDDESDEAAGICYSFSDHLYKCTDMSDWNKGKATFQDTIGTGFQLSQVVVTVNGDSTCSQTNRQRNFTFSLNDQNLGDFTEDHVVYNCGLDNCDAPSAAPTVTFSVSDDDFYVYSGTNNLFMVDNLGDGTGCYGSYNLTLSYMPTAVPSPTPAPFVCCGYTSTSFTDKNLCLPNDEDCPPLSGYTLNITTAQFSCDDCGPLCCFYQSDSDPAVTDTSCRNTACPTKNGFSNIGSVTVPDCEYCSFNRR